MGRKAKYRKYLILILLLACFVLALYVVCNTKNSLTFRFCINRDKWGGYKDEKFQQFTISPLKNA